MESGRSSGPPRPPQVLLVLLGRLLGRFWAVNSSAPCPCSWPTEPWVLALGPEALRMLLEAWLLPPNHVRPHQLLTATNENLLLVLPTAELLGPGWWVKPRLSLRGHQQRTRLCFCPTTHAHSPTRTSSGAVSQQVAGTQRVWALIQTHVWVLLNTTLRPGLRPPRGSGPTHSCEPERTRFPAIIAVVPPQPSGLHRPEPSGLEVSAQIQIC